MLHFVKKGTKAYSYILKLNLTNFYKAHLVSFNFSNKTKNELSGTKQDFDGKNNKNNHNNPKNDKSKINSSENTSSKATPSNVKSSTKSAEENSPPAEVEHKYESKFPVSKDEKENLDKVVKQILKKKKLTQAEADSMAKDMRNPMIDSPAKDLFKLTYIKDYCETIHNYYDFYQYNKTLNNVDKLIMYKRETLQDKDPRYQYIRTIDKLPLNNELKSEIDKNEDQRVNYLSEDFMKKQNRITINYNYNYEQHKEYTKMFKEVEIQDKQEQIQEMKLLKYIKENPDRHNVKHRLMKKIVVPLDKIPNFPVDIEGYTPKVSKKSRRHYQAKKFDTSLDGYTSWRCWDREMDFLNPLNHVFLPVKLSPKKLMKTFGIPLFKTCNQSTGSYIFEDINFDMFMVTDWKCTQLQHGLNFTDEFYKVSIVYFNPLTF